MNIYFYRWSLVRDQRYAWLVYRQIDTICYDIFNCNWVDTRWQYYSTHLHTNNT